MQVIALQHLEGGRGDLCGRVLLTWEIPATVQMLALCESSAVL